MRPVVSVVIPVHNPGRYIDPCIRSILRQTMRPARFEVIFVDDGSTDGTAERLNRLAGEQPHIRVMHIPASGAPGRPRNVGLEAAQGKYVQFLDADDELAPRALGRLYRMARGNDSDIVLGKFASETMYRRQDLFTRNRPATSLEETPALVDASMGATKLFRTALLREHGITFPEGWRQMEDQLFTLRAYLAAKVISVLGDEPCYYFNKREDEAHISAELVDPGSHVEHLGQILDVIEAGVSVPTLQRRLTARFYRTEVLARLTGDRFVHAPAAYQAKLFEALRGLATDRIGDGVQAGLGTVGRIRSRLLLDGNLKGLLGFVRRLESFALDARVRTATWEKGRLLIEYRAAMTQGADGRPVTLVVRDDATFFDPEIADDIVGPIDVTDELGTIRAQVSLVDPATSLEWIVPGNASLSLHAIDDAQPSVQQPLLHGFVEIDPQAVGPGERPLDDGTWDVRVRMHGLGLRAIGLLRVPERERATELGLIRPALLGQPLRWAVPHSGDDGALRIGIGGHGRLPSTFDKAGPRVLRDGGAVAIALPVVTDRHGSIATGRLELTGQDGTFSLPATFRGAMAELVVSTQAARRHAPIPPGRYELSAHLGTKRTAGLPVGAVHVRENGRIEVVGIAREPTLTRLASWASWYADIAREETGELRTAVRQRVVRPLRTAIRSATGRADG
jgi:poly(ribitol-phosphate) beta-N-acetylglucosaminyltransferase